MTDIAVTKVEAVSEIAANGTRIVARFNLCFGGALFVDGCALLHRRDRGWTLWGPTRSVQFNKRVRKEIKLAVLHAMGREIPPQME